MDGVLYVIDELGQGLAQLKQINAQLEKRVAQLAEENARLQAKSGDLVNEDLRGVDVDAGDLSGRDGR